MGNKRRVELLPYVGILYNAQTITFGARWQDVEKKLGKPDGRYAEFIPQEGAFDNQQSQRGDGACALGGSDFKESRGLLEFAYENGLLQMIEVPKGVELNVRGYTFCHQAEADRVYCEKVCNAEYFAGIAAFSLDEMGILVKSQNQNGYVICSRQKYNEMVTFMRFYEQCRRRELDT